MKVSYILGQMEDLGEKANEFHDALLPDFLSGEIDRVYLMGPRYIGLWGMLPEQIKGDFLNDLHAARTAIMNEAKDGDVFMLKGSNSTEMHKVVDWMKRVYRRN